MKFRHRWAACALAAGVAVVAGQANAACTFGQNLVQIGNFAILAIPDATAEVHAQWRVADSASGWVDVPGRQVIERAYGADYPLIVDIEMMSGLRWYRVSSVDVLASVNATIAQAQAGPRCTQDNAADVPLYTTVIVKARDGLPGNGTVKVMTTAFQPPVDPFD